MALSSLSATERQDLLAAIDSGQARLLRLCAQLTQSDVAEQLSVSDTAVRDWESGKLPKTARIDGYYRLICEWRRRFGEVSVAVSEGVRTDRYRLRR